MNTVYFRQSKKAEITRALRNHVTGGLVRNLKRDGRKADFVAELGRTTSDQKIRSNAIKALEESAHSDMASEVRKWKLGAPASEGNMGLPSELSGSEAKLASSIGGMYEEIADSTAGFFKNFAGEKQTHSELSPDEKKSIYRKLQTQHPVKSIFGDDSGSNLGDAEQAGKILRYIAHLEEASANSEIKENARLVLEKTGWHGGALDGID